MYSSLTRGGFCTLVLFIRSCSHHTPSKPLSSSMDDLFTFYAVFLILVIKIPLGAECALCYQKLLLIRNAVYLNKLLGFSHSHFIQSDIYHSPCRLHASSFFVAFQNPHSSISLPLSTHVLHLADVLCILTTYTFVACTHACLENTYMYTFPLLMLHI